MILTGTILVAGISFVILSIYKICKNESPKKTSSDLPSTQEKMFMIKAEQYYEKEQFCTSISYATKAISINARSEYFVQRAFAYSKCFEFKKSISDIDVAILIDPNRVEYLKYKGYLQVKANDLAGALKTWKIAAEQGCEDSLDNLDFFTSKQNSWLKGCEYLDHYKLTYGQICYNTPFKADELSMSIMRITYSNQSTYQLFLN